MKTKIAPLPKAVPERWAGSAGVPLLDFTPPNFG
jgi:hypothetical protein